jgi:predicted nucleic acid-binding protein
MPKRILFDTNVMEPIVTLSTDKYANFIYKSNVSAFSTYFSVETIEESLAVATKPSASQLLKQFSGFFIDMNSARWLNKQHDIMLSEISGNLQLFASATEVSSIKENLKEYSHGMPLADPDQAAKEFWEQRMKSTTFSRKTQAELRAKTTSKMQAERNKITLSEYINTAKGKYLEYSFNNLVSLLLSLDEAASKTRAELLLRYPDRFRYCHQYFDVMTTLQYWQLVMNRKVKDSDLFDCAQLFYMLGLDILVTNDQDLTELFLLFYKNTDKKVLTIQDFIKTYNI